MAFQRKKEGFQDQRLIVLPDEIIGIARGNLLTESLYVTHVGFFPTAKYHFVERKSGADQQIFIYVVNGRGWYKIEQRELPISAGQFFVIPANRAHQYASSPEAPWSIYFVHFSGEKAGSFVEKLQTIKQSSTREMPAANRQTQLIEDMYQTYEKGYTIDNISYVSTCLWRLLGAFSYPAQFTGTDGAGQADVIETSIRYMQENLEKPLTLQTLAAEVNLSVPHFSMIFKMKTGYSPWDYFLRLKIQRACQYLDLTGMTVKEISGDLGFQDQYYFSRAFRRIMGEPPTAYRQKQKG